MYCPKCGRKVADDDLFCRRCGFDLAEKEEREVETLEVEKGEVAKEEFAEEPKKVVNVENAEEKKNKKINPSNVADVCALHAPVSVLIVSMLFFFMRVISAAIYSGIVKSEYNYGRYEMIVECSCMLGVVISIGIYFVIYVLFTRKYREQFSLFLFLVVPGTSMFSNVITYIYQMFYQSIMDDIMNHDLLSFVTSMQFVIYFLTSVAQAIAAYFVARAVFLKILHKSENDKMIKCVNLSKKANIAAIYAPISVCVVSVITICINMNVDFKLASSQNLLVTLLSIGVYFLTYVLFTMKYRDKMSVFLSLVVPGTTIFFSLINYVFYIIHYAKFIPYQNVSIQDIELSQDILFKGKIILLALITIPQAIVAYFVVRAVFLKILRKED